MPSLSQLKPGEIGIVTEISGDRALRRRMLDLGIVRGTRLRLVRIAPLGDPVEVNVRGFNLSLRRKDAEFIVVKHAETELNT